MEIALSSDIPTYSGGLGVLAGDIIRSAADLEVPLIGVTLCYDAGYFFQMISHTGEQLERPIQWEFGSEFEKIPETVTVEIQGKTVNVGAWRYDVIGNTGHIVPVYLLDTATVEQKEEWMKEFTKFLYDATPFKRICQEVILGVGGVRLLQKLGFNVVKYHMNEGHSAFLTLELLRQLKSVDEVRKRCIFTTHTPVPAGHDRFPYPLAKDILRDLLPPDISSLATQSELNMSWLAINMSGYVNAVSRKHGNVSRQIFPGKDIDYITNGVHLRTWVWPSMVALFDKYMPGWENDPKKLKNVYSISDEEIWAAHQQAKAELLSYEKTHSWVLLDFKKLTIGFARRFTGYKRATLIFHDIDRLGRIFKGKAQIIFAGKAHPRDLDGKERIKKIFEFSEYLWQNYKVPVAFLPNYDMDTARLMVAGSDVWLNNPRRYLEASGTSGMKAAINGVPHLSVLDGWWIEGYEMDQMAGWAIGPGPDDPHAEKRSDAEDAEDLYRLLEREVIPIYFNERDHWIRKMKHAIAIASYFNTHRVVEEYASKAWGLKKLPRWTF